MVPDPTGPYSVGMVANGLLFVAGQRPVRKSDGKIPESFADQVSQSLDNMEHVLMQVGCDLGDIVKITAYLANLEDFSKLNDVFRARLPEPFRAYHGGRIATRRTRGIGCLRRRAARGSPRTRGPGPHIAPSDVGNAPRPCDPLSEVL